MSERNLQKRKDIVEQWGTNYFRDFKNIRKYRSGKTFMANPKVFKKEVALYFPNFHGQTLAEKEADTTPALKGRISVVNIYSSHWGEMQSWTFTHKRGNPQLHEILKENKDVAQLVDINVEENTLKAWILALFEWRLRLQRPKEDWGKYFIVRKGISQQIRETIGLLNSRVGYVYLVDEQCKIRWAGSANAEGDEKEYMNKGLQRLIHDLRTRRADLIAENAVKIAPKGEAEARQ
jgi:ATPase complex subunit ATP10